MPLPPLAISIHCPTDHKPVSKLDNASILSWLCVCALFCLSLSGLADEQKLIRVSTQKQEGATHFFIENLQHADVTVTLELDLKNLVSSSPTPYTATIPPRTKLEVFDLSPQKTNEDSSWSYTYYATWGSLTATHDDSYFYSLPYPAGMSFPVSQGFHGKYSHSGGDCYAIDFKMPEGTHVLAARAGVVVGIKDDSNIGGPDKKFEWDANYILVRHSDNTLGHYVHLQKGGCRVKIGDQVTPGQWIGLSGNTGFTTGAHLHFAVFKASTGKQRQTIPIRYHVTGTLAAGLSEGTAYTAF